MISVPALTEWEKLCAAVAPLLEGQISTDQLRPPWQIHDDDLTFISRETGLDPEQVRLWALAFAVGKAATVAMLASAGNSGATPLRLKGQASADDSSIYAIFYGWFRQGLPIELGALWATPTDTLISTLQMAIEQHVVPLLSPAALDGIAVHLDQIKLDQTLAAPVAGGAACLRDLLATPPTPISPDR